MSFTDGDPVLLVSRSSAHQRRCPASIVLEQLRGNLIITEAKPFVEDR